MSEQPTLAKGAELTQETFSDFVSRLRHDCIGEGVRQHYTAAAIFTVQARRFVYGFDPEYTENRAVLFDTMAWHSPQDYWDSMSEDERVELDSDDDDVKFLDLPEDDQWQILGELEDHTVTGWEERWEYVNSHFTRDAAEAFIRRKSHDYRGGLRVFVDAQTYCWEWNAIKAALMDGRLVLADEGVRP